MLTRTLYEVLKQKPYKKKTVAFKGKKLEVEVADTFMKKMIGLMHREDMGKIDGMLFPISQPGVLSATITMENMKFDIDIVWLDSKKRVVDIAEGAKPSTSIFDSYKPRSAAAYVLELRAGSARKLRMGLRDKIRFE